ncbi:MAG TPA: hypothetical protein VMW16_12730 [Sedimentisphaerales bacterium]|nr:hypothetical protein [Sedimentisphaerales bacterium]
MGMKRLSLLVLPLLICSGQEGIGQDESRRAAASTVAEAEPNAQLQLYKEALTNKGSSEQMRVNAANLLLFSKNPLAREILLAVLRQSENGMARATICRILVKAGAEHRAVERSEDFIPALFEILSTEQDFSIARLAAEATLLFEYEQISEQLERMATDISLPVKARLNAVYALTLQPDKRAVIKLIDLVDDPERQVAEASEKALKPLWVPVGKEAKTRRQIRNELERKEEGDFLRERLIYQGAEMRKQENELDWWKKQYLDALNKIWNGISDDTAKGKFLAEQLSGSEAIVRLWALDKVYEDRMRTTPKLPAEMLGPILVNLISHQDRDVRLRTAKLLSLMGGVNSAEKLLEQLAIEQDDEAKTEIFVALGAACSYSLLPASPIKILPETRKQALEWAAKFLSEADMQKSQKGAEVIKRLLERDGLASVDVGRYLGLLVERYQREKDDGGLRGELLIRMAGLCAQGSACKVESARLFAPLFEKALSDRTELVREAAVDGLIYIEKARALNLLTKGGLVKDASIVIRKKLIELAGEVGGKDDLVWLWEKIGSVGESDSAWEAMLRIFKRSEVSVVAKWMGTFASSNPEVQLSNEQKLSFLEIAEQKALRENDARMLKTVREELAALYKKSGKFEQAADYYGRLHDTASAAEKESILPNLLAVYLRWPNVERAANLLDNCLLIKDLGSDSAVVVSIDDYLNDPAPGADPNAVLRDLLGRVKTAQNRPGWREQLNRWAERLGRGKEQDKVGEATN